MMKLITKSLFALMMIVHTHSLWASSVSTPISKRLAETEQGVTIEDKIEEKQAAIATGTTSNAAILSEPAQANEKTFAEFQQAQHKQEAQRATFLQLETLLKSAVKNQRLSAETITLAHQLIESLQGYPLQADALAQLLDSQYQTLDWKNLTALAQLERQILAFMQNYPQAAQFNKLAQYRFKLLGEQQKWQQVSDLAKQFPPKSLEDQAYVLNIDYLLAMRQLYPQENMPHSLAKWASTDIFQRTEKLWLDNATLPASADAVLAEWTAFGGKSADKIEQKMANLFAQNNRAGLEHLKTEINETLSNASQNSTNVNPLNTEIDWLQKLLISPNSLPELANNANLSQSADPILQTAIYQTFARFIKTLPEQMANPDFTPYEQWAKAWRVNDEQQREWKIAFLNRFFDNNNADFQLWRDQQILLLKADKLTERRLRTAIWQKTDLTPWLNALSAEGQQKQEWRYWLAQNMHKQGDKAKSQQILAALSQERGFYPMLAAKKLNQPYQVAIPAVQPLNNEQMHAFSPALAAINELRQLSRFGVAKSRWKNLLETQDFNTQLQLSQYANEQNWWDLAVEGTIIAKAWDYLGLRLPNAYSDYFDINLQNKPIRKSFAMAIARQESAWNFLAQSSANARGLMQLLPSTAKLTAENNQLVYSNESDLFKPFNNIMLGTTHLTELNQKYPNNRILIAAAYNAGARNVEKWLARAKGTLAMDEFIASIPFYETRGYVQNVLAYDYYYQILLSSQSLTNKMRLPLQTFSQEENDRLY